MEMERDLLCAVGRKGTEALKETRAGEADCLGGGGTPVMQWQFQAKSGAAPAAFMSFKTAREEGAKEFSISGFRPQAAAVGDAFDGIKKHAPSPVAPPQQRPFGFDTPATAQQFGHRAQGLDHHHLLGGSRMVQPLSTRHPAPFSQGNAMLRTQSFHNTSSGLLKSQSFAMSNGFGGSTVGAYGARNPRSQNSTQLTIFYNGTVNVFDNVSVEKAQELMLLASKASVLSPPSVVRKPDSPISAPAKINVPEVLPARQIVTQKPEPSVSHLTTTSSPVSVMTQSVALPRSTSNFTIDSTRPNTVVQTTPVVVPASQASTSEPMSLATTSTAAETPRAVPQARKASLARFLEKRKERVTIIEPYPTSKSPLDTKGSATAMSESSFNITPTSNNGEEILRFGQSRNISFSSEACPSTKLRI